MRRSGPITLNFPQFAGATRQLILVHLAAFFGFAVLSWLSQPTAALLGQFTILRPIALLHGQVWQLLTYTFFPVDVLSMLFGMLTLWFFGAWMEGMFGSRKLLELYLFSAAGAGLLASLIAFTGVLGLRSDLPVVGLWAAMMGLLVVFATVMGDTEMYLFFFLKMKAKYVVAVFLLWRVAIVLKGGDRLGALTELCGALIGWLYFRYSPRKGLALGVSESYFSLRNGYYRWKRKRAARKFEVYMRKQNRIVKFDDEGRYIAPDEEKQDPRDRRWMN